MSNIRSHAEVLNGAIYLNGEFLGSCVPFNSEAEGGYIAITCAHVIFGDDFERKITNINDLEIRTATCKFISLEILGNQDLAKKSDVVVLRIQPYDVILKSSFIELNLCNEIDESLLQKKHALIVSPKNENNVSCINLIAFNRNVSDYAYEVEVDKSTFHDIDKGSSGAKNYKGISGSGLFVSINESIFLAGILAKIPKVSITTPLILQKVDTILASLSNPSKTNYISLKPSTSNQATAKLKDVFFNNFTMKSKDFYHARDCDEEFNSYIEDGLNTWIHGLSGTGKTTLLTRNLMQSKTKYIYCDLQPITIESENDIWQGVVDDISFDKSFDYEFERLDVKSLCSYLLKCKLDDNVVLVIDEMSCTNTSIIDDFCRNAINLVGYYQKKSAQKQITFVISSIFSPLKHSCNKGKYFETFETLCSDQWTLDIDKLFDTQNSALGNYICEHGKKIIIKQCNDLPRLLTKIMAKVYRKGKFDLESLLMISETITKEYNAYD